MAREKYLLRDDETGYYWKSTLKQSTIDAIVNPINANITEEVNELQTSLETKLDSINANISAQGTAVVNAITGLQTTLQTSLTELGTKLDALNTGIAGVDASVDEVTAAVNDVNTDTESIDAKMDTANTNITAVKTSVDAVGAKVDTVNTSVGGVATNVQEVGTTVSSIDTKLDTANTKLDTIASNTAPATPGGDEPEQDFPKITLFNGGQSFSPDGSNTFTINKLDGTNFNWYRIKQDGSFLTGKATADGAVLQVIGSENDELNTLKTGSGTFSIAIGGQTKQFNVNVTDNTESAPKAFLETEDDAIIDLSESPTIEVSSGQVYSGTVYVRNATSSQFNGSVTGSIGSGTLLTGFDFDGSSVSVNPGGNSVVRFTATAKADASSSDSAVVSVSIGDNEYTINFAFRG